MGDELETERGRYINIARVQGSQFTARSLRSLEDTEATEDRNC